MQPFAPCPSCHRHVRVDAARCPFCDAPTEGLAPLGFDPEAAPARVRYAALALSATLAASACNPMANVYGGPPIPAVPVDTPPPSQAPVYGGPPPQVLPPMVPLPPAVDASAQAPTPADPPRPSRPRRQDAPPSVTAVPAYGVAPPPDLPRRR